MSEYKDRLAAMDDPFKTAEVRQPFGELPPDGLYQAVIEDFDFVDLSSGLYLKTLAKLVTNDNWDGHVIDQIHALEDPDRLSWVKQHLSRMGIDTGADFQLSELESYLPRLLDVPVEIEVKTSDRINDKTGQPYRNWYVQTRLGDPLGGKRPETSDVPPDTTGLPEVSADDARRAVEAHKAAKGPTGTRARAAATNNDDDIPFD